ncbi:MAG: hypothetical protein OEX03_09400 [Gammaproteobacteria bacterium]|nr:hypothetical protein [Gammaproteobacteria bacterium]
MNDQQAAESVYECLLEFGQQCINPALAVIGDAEAFQSGRHYPEPYLDFSAQGLRTYYHSHSHPLQAEDEHGHFHLFADTGEGCWTHLAALSMDQQGQSRRWLSTNRWVTDECWKAATGMQGFALPAVDSSKLSLVERWLYAMLILYRQELNQLWQQRDDYLNSIKKETDVLLEDREHYVLAGQEIDLLQKMQQVLQL